MILFEGNERKRGAGGWFFRLPVPLKKLFKRKKSPKRPCEPQSKQFSRSAFFAWPSRPATHTPWWANVATTYYQWATLQDAADCVTAGSARSACHRKERFLLLLLTRGPPKNRNCRFGFFPQVETFGHRRWSHCVIPLICLFDTLMLSVSVRNVNCPLTNDVVIGAMSGALFKCFFPPKTKKNQFLDKKMWRISAH